VRFGRLELGDARTGSFSESLRRVSGAVPKGMPCDDAPRGRVDYEDASHRFTVFRDRYIIKNIEISQQHHELAKPAEGNESAARRPLSLPEVHAKSCWRGNDGI